MSKNEVAGLLYTDYCTWAGVRLLLEHGSHRVAHSRRLCTPVQSRLLLAVPLFSNAQNKVIASICQNEIPQQHGMPSLSSAS